APAPNSEIRPQFGDSEIRPRVDRTDPEIRKSVPDPEIRRTVPDRDAGLREERALIEGARRKLLAGEAAGALQLCNKHMSRFAKGQLAEEREVLAVQALVQSGANDAARARAAKFRARFPNSIQLPVV